MLYSFASQILLQIIHLDAIKKELVGMEEENIGVATINERWA
jgi:hypothetical protein